jgi:hypothetical protein
MKELILSILLRSDYITRKTLLFELKSLAVNCNDRWLRNTIDQMIEDGFYIQSSEKGYKLCRSREDFREAKVYLRKKALAILHRSALFDKGLRNIGQLKIIYEQLQKSKIKQRKQK